MLTFDDEGNSRDERMAGTVSGQRAERWKEEGERRGERERTTKERRQWMKTRRRYRKKQIESLHLQLNRQRISKEKKIKRLAGRR